MEVSCTQNACVAFAYYKDKEWLRKYYISKSFSFNYNLLDNFSYKT
ncbi:Uncharacterised protein [Mycobacteroides abscessus subsp. abscessus]|nr:Uncharacterised protein [Mycobacteroides abscessus subsp. abscessus]